MFIPKTPKNPLNPLISVGKLCGFAFAPASLWAVGDLGDFGDGMGAGHTKAKRPTLPRSNGTTRTRHVADSLKQPAGTVRGRAQARRSCGTRVYHLGRRTSESAVGTAKAWAKRTAKHAPSATSVHGTTK